MLIKRIEAFVGKMHTTVHVPTSFVSDCSVVLLLQCLSLLVLNSPYNRLKQGLLTKVARQLRPLLAIKGRLIGRE